MKPLPPSSVWKCALAFVLATQFVARAQPQTPRGQSNTHIHLQMMRNDGRGGFMAPAIVTREVVEQLHAKGGRFQRYAAPGPRMPACLGYLLTAEENPFGTAAQDAL